MVAVAFFKPKNLLVNFAPLCLHGFTVFLNKLGLGLGAELFNFHQLGAGIIYLGQYIVKSLGVGIRRFFVFCCGQYGGELLCQLNVTLKNA